MTITILFQMVKKVAERTDKAQIITKARAHKLLTYMGGAVFTTVERSCSFATTPEEEQGLSYLPLSHVTGLCTGIIGQMIEGAQTPAHTAIFFARLRLEGWHNQGPFALCRPTLFLGVPLVWEKMADKVRQHGRRDHGLMSTLAALSAKVCQASCRAKWKRPSSSRMPSSH